MQIESLTVQNFKGFAHREFAFGAGFNLLVGDNATGKTSVLEAIAAGLEPFLWGIFPEMERKFPMEFVRLERREIAGSKRFERIHPSRVQISATILGQRKELRRDSVSSDETPFTGAFKSGTHASKKSKRSKAVDELPIVAFYEAGRLIREAGAESPFHGFSNAELSRLEAYRDAFSAGASKGGFLSWLRREQYAALQNGKPTPVFSAAVEAMKRCLLHAEHIEYNVQEEDVLARFADGEWRRFSEMSAGQRTMLALVADIAYRAAWLNPHLGTSVLDETPGVVLIDELDLHLHPKWQRRVCDDLRRTFPKMQFIAASHSPFIIQSLQPNELISLDDGEVAIEYANRGVEEIARFIQGVKMPHTSERYARQKEAAKRYFGLLREGRGNGDAELRAAKADLDALTAHFADNPAADAFLELKREAEDSKHETDRPRASAAGV